MRRLTILICTHDRADLLAKALRSLNAATRPPGWAVEILVAASTCRGGSRLKLGGLMKKACKRTAIGTSRRRLYQVQTARPLGEFAERLQQHRRGAPTAAATTSLN